MALQATGPIKYSEIEEEFGVAYGSPDAIIYSETFNDYNGDYYTVYNEFSASGNWVELPFSWVTLYDGYGSNTGSFVSKETTLTTVFDGYNGGTLSTLFDGYTAGQSYLKKSGDLSTGVVTDTVVYEGVEIGTLNGAFLTIEENGIPVRRYSGGNLVVDGGNIFQNPSYYELKVEKIEGQSYLKLFQGVWTAVYEGVNIGTVNGAFLTIGNRRYSGGSRVVDGGNMFVNPSFYQLKVEDLDTSYVFRYNWQIVGSNADGGVLTSGAFKYTRGEASPVVTTNYAIKVEEYKADEVNGTYTYKYGFNDVATSTSTSVTSGTYRYSRGDVRFQGVYDDPSPKNRYVIMVENSPTTYVSDFQGVFTVVENGITLGVLGNDNYLNDANKRYSKGDLVVDNGNTFQSPNYYKLKAEQSNAAASFGNYRVSEQFGSLTLPLDSDAGVNNDTDIPGPGNPIKFSNFYNARLNVAVDYYSTEALYPATEYRGDVRERYNLNDKTSAIGGFKGRPEPSGSDSNTGGTKVVVVVDKNIGSVKLNPLTDDMTEQPKKCALRTGSDWSTGTKMRIEVGDNGKIIGAGGDGGKGGAADATNETSDSGENGGDGSGALGIEYGTDSNPTIVRVRSSGRIITGYGGGGGGGSAFESENNPYRSVSGGGGGGGAGLPVGLKGGKDESSGSSNEGGDGVTPQNQCNGQGFGNDGLQPNDGEQGGKGGQEETTTERDMVDPNGVSIPSGTVVLMGGRSCNTGNSEAISGAGGNGRDQTTDGTTGLENGEGGSGLSHATGENGSSLGGDAGNDGAAVRRSTASIKWKFDTDHVVESVFGEGRNVTPLDISESPTGVS